MKSLINLDLSFLSFLSLYSNERALFFDLKTVTYTTQLHLAEKNGFKTSIGVNGMQQNNTNKGIEQLIPNYNLFDFGSYVYTQKTIKKITLSTNYEYLR